MKPEMIIVLVVMLYNLSDAQNILNKPKVSLNIKGSRKLPEDRRKLSLFPKISKKFVVTPPPPDEKPKYTIQNPKKLEKKRLMPKIVPEHKKENVIPVYRVPITRRPLMKIKKFTLDPYIQQQSNEVNNNRNNGLDLNSYDTSRSNENEDTIISVENLDSVEEYDDIETLNSNSSVEEIDNDDVTTINTENLNSYTENTLEDHGNMDDDKLLTQKYPGRHKQFKINNDGKIYNSKTFINPSATNENEENVNNDETKYDSESVQNDHEKDKFRAVSTENVSDETEVFSDEDLSKEIDNTTETEVVFSDEDLLKEIDNTTKTTTENMTKFTEEFDYTTEKKNMEEVFNINRLNYDQSTYATSDPYVNSYTVVDITTLKDQISVTQSTTMEETTEEFMEVQANDETTQSVIGSRVERSVNIIEEENLGATISGFKFTGREPVLYNHLAFKNINT